MIRIRKFQIQDKTLIIPLVFATVLLAIVFLIAYSASEQTKVPNAANTTTEIIDSVPGPIAVKSIVPNFPLPLTPGLPYTFTVYFRYPIDLKDVSFSLTYSGLYDEVSHQPVKISVSQTNQTTVVIRATEPIKQYSEYILTVTDQQTGNEIFTKGYMTKDVIPTPVPSNNPALIPALPYETDSYILEYFPDRNVYIFHFKYDLDSPKNAEEQFNDAKAAATQFIESKGVDVNSIVIEWRNS